MRIERDPKLESELETAKMAAYGVFWVSGYAMLVCGNLWLVRWGMPFWAAWLTSTFTSFVVALFLFGMVLTLRPVEDLWRYASQRGEDHNPLAFELIFCFVRNAIVASLIINRLTTKLTVHTLEKSWYVPLALFAVLVVLNIALRKSFARR